MIYTPLTKQALQLSFKVHKDQRDRNGMPYVYHPFIVASSMDTETEVAVALLHDVIEDSELTAEDLFALGFPAEVVDEVVILTHDEKDSYEEYVRGIKGHPLAEKVKRADLRHNMDRFRLDANELSEKDEKRFARYQWAWDLLADQEGSSL